MQNNIRLNKTSGMSLGEMINIHLIHACGIHDSQYNQGYHVGSLFRMFPNDATSSWLYIFWDLSIMKKGQFRR